MAQRYRVSAGCLILLLLRAFPAAGAETRILFDEDFQRPLGDRWRQIKFHEPTDYRIVTEGSTASLMAFARGGCSALATSVEVAPGAGITCSWRWRIDRCPKNGSDDKIATFDHAARVFIAFDTWLGPPRTINYVWANQARTNSTFEHPFSSRTKFIVVQTGNDRAGQWLAERRDVQKDWNLLFKGEPMPKIVAIGVFTDSHHTRMPVTGWYRDIVLAK
jgi:hypothetical protein